MLRFRMSFNIAEFARTNKAILIWAAFAALLYIFRDLFGLVFITFSMCFVTHSITGPAIRRVWIDRRILVVAVYLIFLVLIGGFLFFLAPTLLREMRGFTEQLPQAMRVIEAWVDANAADHAWMPQVFAQLKEYLTPEQMILRGWGIGRDLLERCLQYASWFFLGLMFSFLIMLDLPHILQSVQSLRETRLGEFYTETAGSVVLFARVVGENFRAQILISALDTVLMAVCLYLLGIGNIVLLCTLVFFCGLIPVLGVILSSLPVFLMAVNTGGISLGIWSLVLIALISLIEAYILNPRIVSAIMRLNPVITLIILYIAYSLSGLWGMVLGVPVSVYIHRRIRVEQGSAPAPPASSRDTLPSEQ